MRNETSCLLIHLTRYERLLHFTEIRRQKEAVEDLLHDDFFEIGRSGQSYNRLQVIASLAEEISTQPIFADDFSLSHVDDNSALLTYRSWQLTPAGDVEKLTLRTSLWVKTTDSEGVWKLRFHQGTPSVEVI